MKHLKLSEHISRFIISSIFRWTVYDFEPSAEEGTPREHAVQRIEYVCDFVVHTYEIKYCTESYEAKCSLLSSIFWV